jgi:hypothetical protein
MPTEIVIQTLSAQGAQVSLSKPLDLLIEKSADIAKKHSVVM